MHHPFAYLLILSTSLFAAPSFAEKAWKAAPELLYVGPLDPAVVKVDSMIDILVLATAKDVRKAPSEAALVARTFHPAFGAAVTKAARKVEVVDSSATAYQTARIARIVKVHVGPGRTDSARVSIPLPTADSARYSLLLGSLDLSLSSESRARRYVSPTPSYYDPATGSTVPANRKGYSEGPGRFHTLTVRAQWVLWDNTAQTPAARGLAVGESTSRNEPGKAQWEEAARELAKAILRETEFSPF